MPASSRRVTTVSTREGIHRDHARLLCVGIIGWAEAVSRFRPVD